MAALRTKIKLSTNILYLNTENTTATVTVTDIHGTDHQHEIQSGGRININGDNEKNGTLKSIRVVQGTTTTNYEGLSNSTFAGTGVTITITIGATGSTAFFQFQDPHNSPKVVQFPRQGTLVDDVVPQLLEVKDDAWDAAQLTTQGDLNTIGNVDEWLRSVEALAGGGHYEDQWSYFMFWINDIRYADRKHHSNEITTGDSNATLNARQTRTVVESGPTLLNRTRNKLPDDISEETYVNDTDEDQSYTVSVTKTEGTSSTVSVTKQSSITVAANVTIGDFGINASGTVSQDQASSLTKDTTTTKTVDNTILIKARKSLTITTKISTTSTIDMYQTTVQIRGRNGQATINVPNQGGSFADIGQWFPLEALPNLGGATAQTADFKLTTVTKATTIHFKEVDLPPPKPQPVKGPAFPAAFTLEN